MPLARPGEQTVPSPREDADLGTQFAFAIPLMPRAAAADWARVQSNLRRTVDSALTASQGHAATVYIACHDEPDLGENHRDNVQVLTVPFPAPDDPSIGMRDRDMKRRFIGTRLRKEAAEQVFVMFLDADDLVHRDIVRYALGHAAASYVLETGFLMDVDRGLLLRRRTGFYNTCGSSFICHFEADELPNAWNDLDAPFSLFGKFGHEEYPQIASEMGKPPEPLPFPAGVYVVNHGENHWTTVSGRKRILRNARDIVPPGAARRILHTDFAADDLARQVAGTWGAARAAGGAFGRDLRRRLGRLRRRL